jgi:autotransporter-associated beta strand protein
MHRHLLRHLALILATAPLAATSLSASAADYWWRGDQSNTWSTLNAGSNSNFATDSSGSVDRLSLPGSSDVVRFSATNGIGLTTTLGQNFSIQGLTTETTLPQNVSISGSNTLTVGTGGVVTNSPRTLTVNAFLTTNQLSLPINTANAASTVSLNEITFGDFLLHKSGPGTLNLNNTGGHTFGTTVSNGTLNTFAVNAFPFFSRLTLGDSVSGNTPRFNTNSFDANLTLLTIFAPSSSATVIDVGSSTLTLAGNLSLLDTSSVPGNRFGATIAAAAGGTLNLNGNVRTFTLAGQNISQNELVIRPVITNGGFILNANPSTLNGAQAGMILDAASDNTYTGGTTVNAGSLRVSQNTALGPGPLTVNTTGSVASIVRFNNSFQTIASLSSTTVGTIAPVLDLNLTQLTIDQSSNTTFAGNIQGTGNLTKSGTGKLTLTGATTFNGEVRIDTGTIEIGNGGTSGSVSANISNNAALIFNRSDNLTYSGQITGFGTLTKLGTGNLTLASSSEFAGNIFLSQGAITTAAANALGPSFGMSNLTVGQPTSVSIAALNTANFNQAIEDLNLYARFSGAQEAVLVGTSTLTVAGDIKVLDHQDFPGNLFPTIISANIGGKLELSGFSSRKEIIVAGQNNFGRDDLIIQPVITGFADIEISANPSSLFGTPAGVVFAAASPNTYDGNTTVNAGTLTVNSTTSLGQGDLIINTTGSVASVVRLNNPTQSIDELKSSSVGSVLPVLTLSGTALTIQNGGDFNGTIEGTGSVTLPASGFFFLTLRSANTYTGGTTISAGSIDIGGNGTSGSVEGNITNNSELIFSRTTDYTHNGLVTGTGRISKSGESTLTLAAGQPAPYQMSDLNISSGVIHTSDNDLLINYTDFSPIASLISYLQFGQLTANGDLLGLPTFLAIAEAADLGLTDFNGVAIDDTTVVLKYTYVGDANLDGQVDALDYERIDLAIGNSNVFGTAQGDLNYDSNVDALDYEQVDLNIGNGVGSPLGTTGPASVFIPEPAAIAPLALAALATRRRR